MLLRIQGRWTEFRGYTPTDRNLFYLCAEIIPIGFASGALSFNGVFVLKLGASNALIGAMSSLPALMVILFTLPAARLMSNVRDHKPWMTITLGVSRIIYLLIAIVPWVLPAEISAVAIVTLIVVQAIPLALFNTVFMTMIGDVCPPDRRSSLFAIRTTLLSACVAVSAFLSGLFLDRVAFPLNYQILNLIGFALAQYSTYLVNHINYHPAEHPAEKQKATNPAPENAPKPRVSFRWASLRTALHEYRPFVNFSIASFVCWFGAWGAGPLYTIYLVRMLNLSNSWLGANSTLAQIAVVVSAPLWHRIIKRKGDLWVVMRTVLLTGLYPWLIVLLPWPAPLLVIGFANTLNDTAIGIAHTSVYLDIIPAAKRSTFIATYTTLMNVGAMLAPLIATPFADIISVPIVLIICGAIRLLGATLFWIIPPRKASPGTTNTPEPVAAASSIQS
ncbi:MAG: MFS transporter [Chloroflexi bacterium]|nr:MFS transporter [Chloroflexota bacterium]